MKKLITIVMYVLIGIVLIVGCGSPTSMGEAMDNDATVVEQSIVYDNVSFASEIGTLDVGESVRVTHRWAWDNLCQVQSSELTGWVKCDTLEIEE